jgi:hypothetical protein
VLLVGTWRGHPGAYRTIEAATAAAKPGDWILIGPGDYHASPDAQDGVRLSTSNIHLRGMDRNRVIIDGDRPGAASPCSPGARWQNLGLDGQGRDGVVVTDASQVSVENLTICDFVGDGRGVQLSFDGGPTTGPSNLAAFRAAYVTTTATAVSDHLNRLAQYGVYVSHPGGHGQITQSFASNMANSAFHVGACSDCNTVFDDVIATHSVIAFTAIDAGGRLTIEHSTFQDNTSGIDLSSEEDESSPPPQDGTCPAGRIGPQAISPHSCTIIEHNMVHANNNPDVPGGFTQGGILRFIGAGILIAGGRNDSILNNAVTGQGAYGVVITAYPSQGRPTNPTARCQGGVNVISNQLCVFNAFGNVVANNTLTANGTFGNPTNSDLAEAALLQTPGNCFTGNTGTTSQGPSSTPAGLQRPAQQCGLASGGAIFGLLGAEVACATGALGPCTDGTTRSAVAPLNFLATPLHASTSALTDPALATASANYPSYRAPTAPLPPSQPTMPDPCSGVPTNPWC